MHDKAKSVHESYSEYTQRMDREAEQYRILKAQREATHAMERLRSLEEHDAFLRTLGTGDADYATSRSYMREHGLEYRDGPEGRCVLTWAPSTDYPESAYDAQRRVSDSLREYRQAQGQRIANRAMTTPLEPYPEHMQRKAERTGPIPPMNAEAEDARLWRESMDRVLPRSNAPIPPSEQVAQTTAEHADYSLGQSFTLTCPHCTWTAQTDNAMEAHVKVIHAGGVSAEQRAGMALGVEMWREAKGLAQQVRAPGKMFSRVEILAVLRSRKAILEGRQHFDGACRELDALIDIFERME